MSIIKDKKKPKRPRVTSIRIFGGVIEMPPVRTQFSSDPFNPYTFWTEFEKLTISNGEVEVTMDNTIETQVVAAEEGDAPNYVDTLLMAYEEKLYLISNAENPINKVKLVMIYKENKDTFEVDLIYM